MSAELARLEAAYNALCAHLRDIHGVDPRPVSASHLEVDHQAAHRREGTPWHTDAWRLPDDEDDERGEGAAR